ncbi:techylectin-5A-like [Saccostrea cucullata]|uniref:techylectin-5A-like n=1 Tax=Saccostrea cuccullata TaxID=36930 RepID=UPI002ED55337
MNTILFVLFLVRATSAILPEPIDQCVIETTSFHTLLNFASNIVKVKDAICNSNHTLKSGGQISDYNTGLATKEDIRKINTQLATILALLQSCGKDACHTFYPQNCEDLLMRGYRESKVYSIYPNKETVFQVYCDQETAGGGWAVMTTKKITEYGFGNLSNEFWLGNDKIHTLTNSGRYTLRIDLKDFSGNSRYASYSTFNVGNEESCYLLRVLGYSGNAGDAFGSRHNGAKFVTKDRDDDKTCAHRFRGGWWYRTFHLANLNGLYLRGNHSSYANGVNWHNWLGYHYSLMFADMKIRK